MIEHKNIQRKYLKGLLGFDTKDCHPWESDGRLLLEQDNIELRESYSDWFHEFIQRQEATQTMRGISKSICFVDVVVLNFSLTEYRGIYLLPNEKRYDEYNKIVRRLVDEDQYNTLGTHEVFRAGLPEFEDGSQPLTWSEFKDCLDKQIKVVSNSYLIWTDDDSTLNTSLKQRSEIKKFSRYKSHIVTEQIFLGTFPNTSEYKKLVEKSSKKSALENWNNYCKLLKDNQDNLTNPKGERLSVVIGVPICKWTQGGKNIEYTPVGQIFLGIGGEIKKAKNFAETIAKQLSIHTIETNSVTRLQFIGKYTQASQFSHQAAGQIAAILNDQGLSILTKGLAWHLKSLTDIWSNFDLQPTSLVENEFIFQQLKSKTNDEFLSYFVNLALIQTLWRSTLKLPEVDPIGDQMIKLSREYLANDSPGAKLAKFLKYEIMGEIPDWIRTKGFILAFHHSFWQSAYHALRAKFRRQKEPTIWLEFEDYRVSIYSRAEKPKPENIKIKSKDIFFLKQIQNRIDNSFEIEGPIGQENLFITHISIGKFINYESQ